MDDLYFKHCFLFKKYNHDCMTWKFFLGIVFIIVLIFLSTPSALFYFIINDSPYLSDVTSFDTSTSNSSF